MSISSSLYIGTTGIMAQQKNMSVISDNIANVNTVGFKSSHMLFNTLLSQQMGSTSVSNQVGQGVGISSILYDMSIGSFETTNTATDISINGKGFFIVSDDESSEHKYTRAGSFRFDAEGFLRDPQGNILLGYRMPAESILDIAPDIPPAANAPIEAIRLDMQDGGAPVSEPEATTEMRMMINLDSNSQDRSASATSPFTALFDSWDATQLEPLDSGAYSYESAMKVFDSDGNAHVVRAFFDPVEDGTDVSNGNRIWEFLVTIPPAEDASGLDTKKGVVMAGTLTFSAAGELLNMSAFEGSSDDKSSWVPVGLSEEGYPILKASLVGAQPISSALDIGLRSESGWTLPAGVGNLADLDTTTSDLPSLLNADRQILTITNFKSGSSTLYQSQNGYERGFLQSVSVDPQGTLIGYFSNGQDQGLYKIPMADFINPQGLFREGGNLYSATNDSGTVSLGWAEEGRLGSVINSSLENSNVDLATEFVNMIITQKGFDANSKVITTGDQVVQTAIQMKK
ncbi:MAG: flagellar hook protein FlgE [Proteobacteria bacterium]|nr:flagellar hook protein FlgE [Pseudomonadota bacterium]